MATRYGQRPSDLVGLEGSGWYCYQFDRAVLLYGRQVDARLKETDKKGKPKYRTLDAALKGKRGQDVGALFLASGADVMDI